MIHKLNSENYESKSNYIEYWKAELFVKLRPLRISCEYDGFTRKRLTKGVMIGCLASREAGRLTQYLKTGLIGYAPVNLFTYREFVAGRAYLLGRPKMNSKAAVSHEKTAKDRRSCETCCLDYQIINSAFRIEVQRNQGSLYPLLRQ